MMIGPIEILVHADRDGYTFGLDPKSAERILQNERQWQRSEMNKRVVIACDLATRPPLDNYPRHNVQAIAQLLTGMPWYRIQYLGGVAFKKIGDGGSSTDRILAVYSAP